MNLERQVDKSTAKRSSVSIFDGKSQNEAPEDSYQEPFRVLWSWWTASVAIVPSFRGKTVVPVHISEVVPVLNQMDGR
jgi:hypothetical protein